MKLSVEGLKNEMENASSVGYQRFVLLTRTNPNALYCFFENKDAPYYHLRIKHHYKGRYHYIPCGNKKMVLKTYDLIKGHREYHQYKLAFFIDRDYDESIKDQKPGIYETPCYSIENLYCSSATIIELIKTDFQIGEEDPLHLKIVELYTKLQSDFFENSIEFNAWYKLQRKKSRQLGTPININLTDSLIPTYIEFSLEGLCQKYTLRTLDEIFPDTISYDIDELSASVDELRQSDLRLVLRGKYIFNFMTTFIRRLIEDGKDPSKRWIIRQC